MNQKNHYFSILVKQVFKEADLDGNGLLDRAELYEASTKNQALRQLLEESIKNVKKVDKIIENDLEEPFHCWIPISANL